MGSLTRFNLALLRKALGIGKLYETGTGLGRSTRWASECGIPEIVTVEKDSPTFDQAKRNLEGLSGIKLMHLDGVEFLASIPAAEEPPRLFYLDAHFVDGADFKGSQALQVAASDPRSFPLLDELRILAEKDLARDWIIIDDARLYVDGMFAAGECPKWARQWDQRQQLDECLATFAATHDLQLLRQDHGYFLLAPKQRTGFDPRDAVRVLAGDLPGNGTLEVRSNIPGVTAISIQRRIADHRFATRYFVGQGLDIGGGIDSLALYQEFFPLARCITRYDWENGDAQALRNVDDNTFDFVYSSHCLEHMRDARAALANWLRVVRSGGHLVIQAPDEDLYEQGNWPSRYNSDHKLTFTICKASSWSPVSINLLDLLKEFSTQAKILSIAQIDHGYRSRLVPSGMDQTRTPLAECGIEFVLRKY